MNNVFESRFNVNKVFLSQTITKSLEMLVNHAYLKAISCVLVKQLINYEDVLVVKNTLEKWFKRFLFLEDNEM